METLNVVKADFLPFSVNSSESNILSVSQYFSKDIDERIKRKSQNLGQLSPVEILSDDSFEQIYNNKTYILNQCKYSIESRFNNSSIIVTDLSIKEVMK
uniref:Uncharacterized protein n=1 Tax=viral metagenome TaxID=1070528 RepID=A0A6C0BE08_9ZZZZ